MTKEIFNEGRVVGLSSYEEYVRQLKSVDPDFDICTEREWLAASLAAGSSMILRVSSQDTKSAPEGMPYVIQYEFPKDCHISSANPIIASHFLGNGDVENNWVVNVTDYGPSISNTSSSSPNDNSTSPFSSDVLSNVPVGDLSRVQLKKNQSRVEYTQEQKSMMEYTKILDGIVIQPGTWQQTDSGSPYKDFEPDLSKRPTIRLTLSDKVNNDFFILLTGFTNRSIIRGISKFDLGSVDTEHPYDGDFIGPECYPWVSKISFLTNSSIANLTRNAMISGSRNLKIEASKETPEIKITSNNLLDTKIYKKESNLSYSTITTSDGIKKPVIDSCRDKNFWLSQAGSGISSHIMSQGNDPTLSNSNIEDWVSGTETQKGTVDLNKPTDMGLVVDDKYKKPDNEFVQNGQHGGWYDISIDPYQLIGGFIEEAYRRWDYQNQYNQYVDSRMQYIQNQIDQIINYITSDSGGISDLVNQLNKIFELIYNGDTPVKITTNKVDISQVTSSNKQVTKITGAIVPTYGIPTGNINIYSGDDTPDNDKHPYKSSPYGFIRSNSKLNNNDLWAK